MSTSSNPVIGLDNVVIAQLTADSAGTTAPTYDTPISLAGAVQASVANNGSVSTDWADNGPFFAMNNRGNIELTLELTNMAASTYALVLGNTRANGITIERPEDTAPFFALGFRVWIGGTDSSGDKIYEYFWYAKGVFSVPDSGANSKTDSISFQHKTLKVTFIKTQYYADADDPDGVLVTHGRSDEDLTSDQISTWFDAPVLTTDANTSAVTVTAAESSGDIAFTFVKSDSSTFYMSEDSASLGSNILIQLEGEEVAGTLAWTGQGTASVVATFTPTTAFTSADVVIASVTSGLKDVNGVSVTPYSTSITIA